MKDRSLKNKKYRRQFYKGFLWGIVLTIGVGIWKEKEFFSCMVLRYFLLQKIAENVYVDADFSPQEQQKFLKAYKEAQQRISFFYGKMEAEPILIACHSVEKMQIFAAPNAQTGMTHLSFAAIYVVVEPRGMNEDVLSHELCHAELMQRIGWQNRRLKIPVWFDEGLAMLVDKRFPNWEYEWLLMTNNGKEVPNLEHLATGEAFFSGNTYLHYLTAQKKVSTWYAQVGKKGLLDFISHIQDKNITFDMAFEKVSKDTEKQQK